MRCAAFGLIAVAGLLLANSSADAAVLLPKTSVTLAWDPSTSTNVTSYKIYYGVVSGTYTNAVNAKGTEATVTNLNVGVKYFFAATSVNAAGLESDFSNEISYAPTTAASMRIAMSAQKRAQLLVRGPAGYSYDVLTSSTPTGTTWSRAGSITLDGSGIFQYDDPSPATNKSKMYRLQQTSP